MSEELVTVSNLFLKVETDKAYGVIPEISAEEKSIPQQLRFAPLVWIPKSQVDRSTLKKGTGGGEVDIPQWIAEKNNLEYEI